VGPKAVAKDVYQKRKNAVREGRFFPEQLRPLDPLFADHVADYLARKRSALLDLAGADRYARCFRNAPDTKGKSMRQLLLRKDSGVLDAPGRWLVGARANTLLKRLCAAYVPRDFP
jgi:hypothetical protein